MDLIIQITPSVVRDNVAGITKTEALFDLEKSIIDPAEESDSESTGDGEHDEK